MGFFDAFYFMSYTATTIGFGELPYAFTYGQRMWVVVSIYLTVVGWAYAIGSLLTLIQDRAFRQALALRRFTAQVARLREPFLLIAGYGRTGELLARSFDALGRQVVIEEPSDRIDALDLDTYHADIPGLAGDAAQPAPPRRRRPRPSALRGGAGADRRRRGQSRRHHGGGAAAARTAGHRPDGLDGDRRADAGLRHPHRGQPLRPLRRPSAARAARARLVPAARVARSRTRRAAAANAAARRGTVNG